MPDEAAFIQTIREHPDDDGPRLVYADWLEEHGECDRAEFIRIQIELARGVKDRVRREQLTQREQALYKKPIIRWVRKNIRWVDTFLFHRGTLSHVLVKALDYLRRGQELFDLAPIMEISLRNLNGHVRELARAPTLQLLRTLDLCANFLQPSDVSTILASPYLESLRELDLRANRLGNPGARVVLSTQSLCRLERLLLANNGIAGGDWVIPRSPLR